MTLLREFNKEMQKLVAQRNKLLLEMQERDKIFLKLNAIICKQELDTYDQNLDVLHNFRFKMAKSANID
jgi:hypothetical protein